MRLAGELRKALALLARLAADAGLPAYLVGGCVRDALLGGAVRDVDAAVEGDAGPLARALAARLGGVPEAFDRFGTARLRLKGGARLDLARTRAEVYAKPAALPEVRPAPLAEDLRRRDFTVNAMARRLEPRGEGELIDPFGGREDLRARRLRVLHPESFREDPTRLFRAARYAGRLGLALEPGTARLLRESVRRGDPALLSRERLRQELTRILEERDPGPALGLLKRWGLTRFLHPEFRWPPGVRRPAPASVRLGLCALAMPGRAGEELLASLPLPREDSQALKAALRLARAGEAPRDGLLPELAREVLRRGLPRLPKAALEPVRVSGEDLRRLGLPPGPRYAELLREAARAQWRGRFSDRRGALRWLGRKLDAG